MRTCAVFSYKGREIDPRIAGRELGVQAVFTGKLVSWGERLFLSTELVNAADGVRLWGQQYERPLSGIIALQTDLARQISDHLRLRLTGEQQRQLARHHTENPEAHRLYPKGRHNLGSYNEKQFKEALNAFKQALDLDPTYAPAFVGISDSYYSLSNLFLPPNEAMPKSRSAAQKALELDETLAEAHTSLGIVKSVSDWDWAGAEHEFKRALEINPGSAPAHHAYGLLLVYTDRGEEALIEFKRARDLDPLSASIATTSLQPFVYASPSTRRPDLAIEGAKRILAIETKFSPAYLILGLAYLEKGMGPEACAPMEKARQENSSTIFAGYLANCYGMTGKHAEAKTLLEELQRRSKAEHASALSMASAHAGLDDREKAFSWLEKAYINRDEELVFLHGDPQFDKLRSDPRFIDLLRRLGLSR
ncbi:MAG: TPR end-of-group domain-containing protein [Blastocatellia bacterium]